MHDRRPGLRFSAAGQSAVAPSTAAMRFQTFSDIACVALDKRRTLFGCSPSVFTLRVGREGLRQNPLHFPGWELTGILCDSIVDGKVMFLGVGTRAEATSRDWKYRSYNRILMVTNAFSFDQTEFSTSARRARTKAVLQTDSRTAGHDVVSIEDLWVSIRTLGRVVTRLPWRDFRVSYQSVRFLHLWNLKAYGTMADIQTRHSRTCRPRTLRGACTRSRPGQRPYFSICL